jgi:hypothetical protein
LYPSLSPPWLKWIWTSYITSKRWGVSFHNIRIPQTLKTMKVCRIEWNWIGSLPSYIRAYSQLKIHNISEEKRNTHSQYFQRKSQKHNFQKNYLGSHKLHWLDHFASQWISWSPFFLFSIKILWAITGNRFTVLQT